MKRLLILALLAVTPLLPGCGYQNPYLAANRQAAEVGDDNGEPVLLHIGMWHNRTNELGLQLAFFNQLNDWFHRSKMVRLSREADEADYSLEGEILSIDEGMTRGTVRLTVGYALYDLRPGEPILQVAGQTFSGTFFIADDAARTRENKRRALEKIAGDLAESIYMRTHYLIGERRRSGA
jgi:hypothetical protein